MALKWSKSELLEASLAVYELRVEGKTDKEIMEILRYDAETFEEVTTAMYESRAERMRVMPREHVYIDYVTEQRRNIKDLNDLVTNLDKKTQYNALVGAIRLRSDILDKIVEKGQEFGVIKKQAQRTEIVAGLLVHDMTQEDLRKGILGQTKLLKDVMERYGDGDIMSLTPETRHYALPAAITTTASPVEDDEDDEADLAPAPKRSAGTARAKMSKRSAGRKRTRE